MRTNSPIGRLASGICATLNINFLRLGLGKAQSARQSVAGENARLSAGQRMAGILDACAASVQMTAPALRGRLSKLDELLHEALEPGVLDSQLMPVQIGQSKFSSAPVLFVAPSVVFMVKSTYQSLGTLQIRL